MAAKACFHESTFISQSANQFTIKLKVNAQGVMDSSYGDGFPAVGQPMPRHSWDGQPGNIPANGEFWVTVRPDGSIAGQPANENPAGWQLFTKQAGLVFVHPTDQASFAFVYQAK
jgi:hypothetical protein